MNAANAKKLPRASLFHRPFSLLLLHSFVAVGALLLARPAAAQGPSDRHTFGDGSPVPETAKAFENLLDEVTVTWDDTYVYVRSDSIPTHRMMVGIKAWNQQVPIPHDLEFKLPIKPKLLDEPAPTTLLGPLAIAVNGIPIFDPTTQGGKHDAYEHGELDEFGGHAGRADDYHYHIAPFHLAEKVGKGNPIAFGLDGLPVYPEVHGTLDSAHGHFHDDGSYHYHGTTEKPYYMSGFRGEVDLDARPRTHGVRPYTRPLRGATITDFTGTLEEGYALSYELAGEIHRIEYKATSEGADFTFVSPDGTRQQESYQRRSRNDVKPKRGAEKGNGKKRGGNKGGRPPTPRSRATPPNAPTSITPQKEVHITGRSKPNFIVILIDDMGWKDTGFSGSRFIETPHIDRLAKEGVIFTQAYASAPNCAPTRACLMSGQTPPRHGVYTVVDERHAPGLPHHKLLAAQSQSEMATEVTTLAEALKPGGYATGCFGMWNLGRGHDTPTSPEGQGFDLFHRPQDLGFERNTYFHPDGSYLPDRLTEEALRFAHSHRDQPFFIYFAPHSVHAPFDPKPHLLKKYQAKPDAANHDPVYAATIEALDWNIGRMRAFLEKMDLARQTTIIFTSDNGGNRQYTAPLNGGKGQLYEGGIRVPACAWGYGVTAKGTQCSEVMATIDIYPTLLDLAGLTPPPSHHLDGRSLVPVLNGSGSLHRDTLHWHFPSYIGRSSPCSAIRVGDYKLIEFFEGPRLELYNLRQDPNEQHNLATREPNQARRLHQQLQTWQRATAAAMPPWPNPNYDPSAVAKKGKKAKKS